MKELVVGRSQKVKFQFLKKIISGAVLIRTYLPEKINKQGDTYLAPESTKIQKKGNSFTLDTSLPYIHNHISIVNCY